MRLNWQKYKFIFDYGFDENFFSGIAVIINSVSIAIIIGHYWIGISH